MRLNIIQIGNSYGIRIPKAILKQCGFEGTVMVSIKDGQLIISPDKKSPRAGWAEEFKEMAAAGDDVMGGDDFGTSFDDDEWEW